MSRLICPVRYRNLYIVNFPVPHRNRLSASRDNDLQIPVHYRNPVPHRTPILGVKRGGKA